ncbi:MAG TPA: hypothetical protein VKE40_17470 [Gemmataceae bacterium]|nr:hypothetical protein [Gemmataceae bacterium]
MLAPVMYAFLAASAFVPVAKQLPDDTPRLSIVVFRHHPGIIAKEAVMKARDQDAEILLEAAKEHCGGYNYEGGLGRGYELSLPISMLPQWKAAVDKMIKSGALRHYDHWGLDHNGYGLVPIR